MTTAAAPALLRSCTVLIYAVPNTELRVLVDGIQNPDDFADAEAIARGVVRDLAATPAARQRARVVKVDEIATWPPATDSPTPVTTDPTP